MYSCRVAGVDPGPGDTMSWWTTICLFVCLFVYLFILGRKPNRQNCLLKEVLREREEKKRKKRRKVIRW